MPSVTQSTSVLTDESLFYLGVHCDGTEESVGPVLFPSSVMTQWRNKNWNRTPNYRQLVRARARLPDQTFLHQSWSLSSASISYPKRRDFSCTGQPGGSMRFDVTTWTLAPCRYVGLEVGSRTLSNNSCIARLLERARGAEWQAPVFFAEAGQTVNMVLGTARTLASSYRNLRRGNLGGAMRDLGLGSPSRRQSRSYDRSFGRDARRAAANRWLELQYGWIPLLMDVQNAAETLAEIQTDSSRTVGRVSSNDSRTTSSDSQVFVEFSPTGTARKRVLQEESVRAVWKFEPTGLNNLGSLGLLNPLSVAWELVPLSFVVDWFLPVGRYLEQLDTSWRFKHVGGSIGYKRLVRTEFSQFRRDGVDGSGVYNQRFETTERAPFTSVPSLGLESIWFEPNLGVRRLFSGLALASQAFR